ncbi:DUF397 domain-containing protein [Actinomadura sp. LD22]|uniref:DUF397 domain-containing protein n=1 Tax=Actinomadura physcomitrii TaxID=2650748 RepID=A0A6I4MLY1_9ACTN|nr:DUF397 domain-containing protein [Actinomadura physcomitrii]MWA04561.1 DUF397 domain-containing protein [Actinomadura physcomitrii]
MTVPLWRKSSHSGPEQGDCVEVADVASGVGVRDSKNPQLGHLTLTPATFADLIARAKRNELDL